MHVHSLFVNVVSVSSPGEYKNELLWSSVRCSFRHPYTNCSSCKQNSELDVQFLLNFKAETKLWHFNVFDSWNPRQFCVCVCVEMLFLSDFTSCWGSEMDLWLMFGFVRNENKRGWLCEIFANKKIWNLSVSLLWKSLQNFELQKSVIDLWRLWKCKTLPNEFKFKVKLKCFSSMEKDNQIKLKISGLEKILSDLPMVLGDFVKRGESNIENPNIERVVAGQLSQFTMSFWDDMCM